MMTPPQGDGPLGSDRHIIPDAQTHPVSQAMHHLFGRDSLYMVLWVLQLVGAAAMTPAITRLLGPAQFGTVAASIAVMQVLFVIGSCGLNVALQRRFADGGGRTAAAGLLTLSLAVAVATTAVSLLTGRWWSPMLGFQGFPLAVQLAVLWAGTSAATATCLSLLRSQDRLAAFATVSFLQSVVAETVALVMLVSLHTTASAFILGELVAQCLALGAGLLLARPRLLRPTDRPLIRSGFRFGIVLIPAFLSGLLLASADRFLLQVQMGAEAVARYQVAYNIGQFPMLILLALDTTWLPRIFALEDSSDRDAVLAASRAALYRLLAPVMLGLSLGAPIVMALWAPPSFRTGDLSFVTAVVIITAAPYAAGASVTRGLLARSATGAVATASVLAVGANIALNLVLIPALGLLGAALATWLAYVLQHLLLLTFSGGRPRLRRPASSWAAHTVLGSTAALAAALLPVGTLGLAFRASLGVGCLAWLARVLWTTASGRQRYNRLAPTGPGA
jgi:O-antigen/teichoic acid export membrane protein